MVLEKTLESPLDCKEIQPVNPKEISPEYSLEGLMLKLKLQYFGHLMQSRPTGKDPDAGKDGRQEKGNSRDVTWPTKVHIVKPMVFPVVIYGCESWTIKKSEHQRIDAFEPWS